MSPNGSSKKAGHYDPADLEPLRLPEQCEVEQAIYVQPMPNDPLGVFHFGPDEDERCSEAERQFGNTRYSA
jgi:hypothetical protein